MDEHKTDAMLNQFHSSIVKDNQSHLLSFLRATQQQFLNFQLETLEFLDQINLLNSWN
jgi:hypothetical protein